MTTDDERAGWQEGWRARAQQVLDADTTNFVELFRAAGLDPAKHARYADWSGVDFSGCDVSGFDFTGARLHGCRFERARLIADPTRTYRGMFQLGLNFSQAELGQVIHRPGRDPHAPAEMTDIADLSKAEDWQRFRDPAIWDMSRGSNLGHASVSELRLGPSPNSDAHLPTGAIFQDAPFAPQMVVLPAGEFWMGSPNGETGRIEEEGPRQRITIEQRFALGRFAVTFEEYDAYAEAAGVDKPKDQGWGRGRQPVINVSHNDAEGYARWLSELTGQTYRLPSEAEWEYACRADTETPFWWGDTISLAQANYEGRQAVGVDQYDPNPWGLYQMHGNILEWCADAWHDSLDGLPPDGFARARVDANGRRVVRGGSWLDTSLLLSRSACRDWLASGFRVDSLGFRLARTLNP